MNPLAPQVHLQLPVKLLPILKPMRFKIMHGGRGGAKSHTAAQVLLMLSMQRKLRILCVREVQKSLKDSVWQLLLDWMDRFGIRQFFDVVKSESRITCKLTGSTFAFSGLKDHTADSIKSFEGCNIVWVEEAHSVTAHSWTILIPTILRTDGAELWATLNPDQEDDYVYNRFVKNTDPNAWVVQINWRDNPWFNVAMNEERLQLKALNDDLYNHVWEGKPRTLAGLLFKRQWFENRRFDLGQQPKNLRNYLASDYAGEPDLENPESEPDWTEHGVFGVDEARRVWLVDWWSGQESPNVYIHAWLGLVRAYKPQRAFEEKGVILRTISGYVNRAMQDAGIFVLREGLASSGSKYERALAFAALCATGMVWIPRGEWGDRLINQLCAFSGQDGKVDDMVDVCSKFAQGLDMVWAAEALAEKDKPKTPDDIKPGAPAPMTEAYLRQLETIDEDEKQKASEFY